MIAQSIRQKINQATTLVSPTQDTMIIGGIFSNLSSTDAYLTLKPFLINAKIEQGYPFQLQTKTLISTGQSLSAWASNSPVNLVWELISEDEWNSESPDLWVSEGIGTASVLLDLTIAGI